MAVFTHLPVSKKLATMPVIRSVRTGILIKQLTRSYITYWKKEVTCSSLINRCIIIEFTRAVFPIWAKNTRQQTHIMKSLWRDAEKELKNCWKQIHLRLHGQ